LFCEVLLDIKTKIKIFKGAWLLTSFVTLRKRLLSTWVCEKRILYTLNSHYRMLLERWRILSTFYSSCLTNPLSFFQVTATTTI
jgi:hypothetical protein